MSPLQPLFFHTADVSLIYLWKSTLIDLPHVLAYCSLEHVSFISLFQFYNKPQVQCFVLLTEEAKEAQT